MRSQLVTGACVSSEPIAYVISTKDGIPSFIKREIETLVSMGFKIDLYATKMGTGVYSVDLPCERVTLASVVLGNITCAFLRPRRYFGALAVAARNGTITELAVAAGFSRTMICRGTKIIHSTFGDRKFFVSFYASSLIDAPLTTTIHSHEITFYLNHPLFAKAMRRAQRVFTVSKYNKDILDEKFPDCADKTLLTRLFVDLDRFRNETRVRVLTVAKFYKYKGYDTLVKAAKLMDGRKVVFWVVGEGPEDVRGMVAREGMADSFVFYGAVNEETLLTLYDSCDVFCLPSKTDPAGQKEGLPVSLMEAMAFSKPVVSTRHAGIPELVPSILVGEDDPQGLAEALAQYADDRERRISDGKRNRSIVEKEYSPKNLQTMAGLFGDIIEQGGKEERLRQVP